MTSFKFPPPPPPPPKAASDAQPSYSSQRGGSSRGRGGDRGRGRGGQGRGGSSFSQGRGNDSSQGHGNAHGGRGGARGAYGGLTQHEQPLRQPAAANAYGIQATAHTQPQANPQAPRFSPGQHAGHKRKRPEHNTHVPPLPPKKPQSGPKPPRAKAAAPPPVPSFGFALPAPAAAAAAAAATTSAPTPAPAARPNHKRDGKKRVNLGLGAQHAVEDSSSDEDVDEEAAFADKVKVEGVAFEHDGEMISLQTAADVQAYIQDRRRNFPTQQRIAEKAQEAAAKREHELDFLYRVKGKKRPSATVTAPPPPKPDHRPRPVDTQKQEKLAALRKKLHESMLHKQQNRTPPPSNLLGAGYDSETDADSESSVLSESSVVSESEDSSEDDDGDGNEQDSDSDSDSDIPPCPTSSKIPLPPITVPPPVPAPVPAPTPSAQLCKNWAQTGRCKFGRGCRWAHPAGEGGDQDQDQRRDKGKARSREMPGEKKIGLYEKLVEQELERGERVALAAVKYLGQNGFLG